MKRKGKVIQNRSLTEKEIKDLQAEADIIFPEGTPLSEIVEYFVNDIVSLVNDPENNQIEENSKEEN